jgi:hypothetical protein
MEKPFRSLFLRLESLMEILVFVLAAALLGYLEIFTRAKASAERRIREKTFSYEFHFLFCVKSQNKTPYTIFAVYRLNAVPLQKENGKCQTETEMYAEMNWLRECLYGHAANQTEFFPSLETNEKREAIKKLLDRLTARILLARPIRLDLKSSEIEIV